MAQPLNDERMTELLMLRVTGTLSAAEQAELQAAMRSLPAGEVARWEQAAAELTAALAETSEADVEPMPADLRARLVQQGEAFVAAATPVHTPIPVAVRAPQRTRVVAIAGWMAAAASVALWIGASRRTAPAAPSAPVVASATAMRDSLLRDSTVTQLAWTATPDSAAVGASGDVVWDAATQRGVMHIVGLQPNDRRRWQYQLWIFDKTRDDRYPVDGGVFDVPAGQTTVDVPIDARVPVGDAVMFAITVEKPGGVVVSTRERIALLAQRKS
jgi:hypothetical protein